MPEQYPCGHRRRARLGVDAGLPAPDGVSEGLLDPTLHDLYSWAIRSTTLGGFKDLAAACGWTADFTHTAVRLSGPFDEIDRCRRSGPHLG